MSGKYLLFVVAVVAALGAQPVFDRVDTIGGTTFDWQQSGPALTTIVNDPQRGVYVTWMRSLVLGQNFPDRNKGYNFFDRNTNAWTFIDPNDFMNSGVNAYTYKTGYGSLDVDPVTGCAYISAHYTTYPSMAREAEPGIGIFEECPGPPDCSAYVWPVSAFGNSEAVHNALIDAATRSQVYYSRLDPWCTWSTPFYISSPPGIDPRYPSHFLAASRQSGALLISWSTPLEDTSRLFLRRSPDGGTTWEDPYELRPPATFTPGSDTAPVFDVSAAFIAFDRNDNWHLVATIIPMVGGLTYILPAEIWHYSPANTPNWSRIARASCDTLNLRAPVGDDAVFACRPNIAFNPGSDDCFVVWEQFDSMNVESQTSLLRADAWAARSPDNGLTWTEPIRLTIPDSSSKRYPNVALVVNDTLHIVYEADQIAGFSIPNHQQSSVTNNPIIYLRLAAGNLDVTEPLVARPAELELAAAPNPFRNCVAFSLSGTGPVHVTILDATGRTVRMLASGSNPMVWDGRNAQDRQVPAGVYFYKAGIAGREITGKVLKTD
jgi:hypothetical protein